MSVICFASYEIHPTTTGGCGVLLHHAAERLLAEGHTVLLLLDVPPADFERFQQRDRLALTKAENCRAYSVDALCADFPYERKQIPEECIWKSLRFGHAYTRLAATEQIDVFEFVEYCGIGYYAMLQRLYGQDSGAPILAERLHTSLELIDAHGPTRCLDRNRYLLYGLERSAMVLAEAVLAPTDTYCRHYYNGHYGLAAERVIISQPPKLEFPRVTRRPDPHGPFTIVHLGRLFQFKGVYQIVLAAAALMQERPELDFTVDLIGADSPESPFGNSYIEHLKTLVPAALRPRFRFPGHLTHAELAERLNQTLFAVFPNRLESFCYAVHELYDAGVPVVVNELPAWADFLRHRANAYIYDGSTQGLLAAMKEMIDNDALRESLARPYVIADQPLGDFYKQPRRLSAIAKPAPERGEFKAVVVVLAPEGKPASSLPACVAMGRQKHRDFDVVVLSQARERDEGVTWWLGRPWRAAGMDGAAVEMTSIRMGDALAVLRYTDRPAPDWLERSVGALQRREAMAFAGGWLKQGSEPLPLYVDIAPELYPFECGSTPTRALIRTHLGRLLCDAFDPNLGNLGEIGYLWSAVAEWGRGHLYPAPLIEVGDEPDGPLDLNLLNYLLARYGKVFEDRFVILSGILKDKLVAIDPKAGTRNEVPRMISVEEKLKLADELGGRDLLKMGFRKLARRLGLPI